MSEESNPTSVSTDIPEDAVGVPEDGGTNENDKELALYTDLAVKYKDDKVRLLFEFCFIKNIPFSKPLAETAIKAVELGSAYLVTEIYMDSVKEDVMLKSTPTFFSQLNVDSFDQVCASVASLGLMDEETKKERLQIISVFGYDPFRDDRLEDRPQLYRDLVGMTTEAMRKDIAKQKAALSIVRSYANIEQYQRKISEITSSGKVSEDTQKQLDQYLKVISTIQGTINQTAEKNNFTVKGIGSNGKGVLSDVMNQVEDYGVDEGVTNFYDISTSKSIQEVAEISFKAQLNQINLSKTDYSDILAEQFEIVQKAQRSAKDAVEALRLAKEKIVKQELLDELAADYRKKGISEEEIEEFIQREYHMYDTGDRK